MSKINQFFACLAYDSNKMVIPWKKEHKQDHFIVCNNRENKCEWQDTGECLKGEIPCKWDNKKKKCVYDKDVSPIYHIDIKILIFDDIVSVNNYSYNITEEMKPYIEIIRNNFNSYKEQRKDENLDMIIPLFKE